MARLERRGPALLVTPETDDERALLAHGVRQGGELMLEGALYVALGGALLLPTGCSPRAAARVGRAFAAAALGHRTAQRRRRRFRLL